jgi:hypothetical protein
MTALLRVRGLSFEQATAVLRRRRDASAAPAPKAMVAGPTGGMSNGAT